MHRRVQLFAFDLNQAYGGTIEELEDGQLQLQTLLSMRHVTPFREMVQVRPRSNISDISRRHHKMSNTAPYLQSCEIR